MNLLSILFPQTIFKTSSKFSGEIKVIDHVFERRLVIGGLTQSGGILKGMWKKALNQQLATSNQQLVKDILVLGLGAGTVAGLINQKWPDANITGVEIDPVIIDVGKKYFHLGDVRNLKIVIGNAITYINTSTLLSASNELFDLVIVDLYKGFLIEKGTQDEQFLRNLARKTAKNGIVIFNVITGRNSNFEASFFLDKLHRIFQDNFCKRIISNDFFFCSKPFTKRR